MTWRTNRLVILARNLGRMLGLNRHLAKLVLGPGYETTYDDSLRKAIQPGDVVWDIGANRGLYTRQFSDRVGEDGHVFAFEPSSANFDHLARECGQLTNVSLFQFALGEQDGEVAFAQGDDEIGATSRVVEGKNGVSVEIRSGDSLLSQSLAESPDVVKIDVEGFELEVLAGMQTLLSNPKTRAVGVEVHFRLLEERGKTDGARSIEKSLQRAGYQVSWADPSHVIAERVP